MTTSIQITPLSIPRALASRATHTRRRMFRTINVMMNVAQPPHAKTPVAASVVLSALNIGDAKSRAVINKNWEKRNAVLSDTARSNEIFIMNLESSYALITLNRKSTTMLRNSLIQNSTFQVVRDPNEFDNRSF